MENNFCVNPLNSYHQYEWVSSSEGVDIYRCMFGDNYIIQMEDSKP